MQFPFQQLIFQILICCCCSISSSTVGNEPFKSGSPLRRIFEDRFVQSGKGEIPVRNGLLVVSRQTVCMSGILQEIGGYQERFDELASEMCHRGNDRLCSLGWIMPLLYQFIHQPINQIIMAALITASKPHLRISPYQPFINSEFIALSENLKCFFCK